MTAAEFMAQLEADPEFVASRERDDAEQCRRAAELDQAEAPLVEALQRAGLAVRSIWDLAGGGVENLSVLPLLIEHLQKAYPDVIREGIAQALAVPESIRFWPALKRLYVTEGEIRTRDAIAVALDACVDEDHVHDLIEMAQNPAYGESRNLFLAAIGRSRRPEAAVALRALEADPELQQEARRILRMQRTKGGRARKSSPIAGRRARYRAETSTSLDRHLVGGLLRRVSSLVSGFGAREIAEVLRVLRETDVEAKDELSFEVDHHGAKVDLWIGIFMDDVDAPDLTFRAPAGLIDEIEGAIEAVGEEHGL